MRYKNLLILLLMISVLFGCTKVANKTVDSLHEIYTPKESSNFTIHEIEGSKNTIISVINPWQGADGVKRDFLIVRDSVIPADFNGQLINGEAMRIVCMSTTHIAMLDSLGVSDRIVGISGKPYMFNEKLLAKGELIRDVGYEENMNYEALLQIKPDLVLLFAVNGASTLEKRLEELGIPYLYVGEYLEESPLGKAEWVVPLAEVTGRRERGIQLFEDISRRYDEIKNKVPDDKTAKPKVMLNTPLADSWFMPSTESYVARMMKDAGADYVYKKNTGNRSEPIDKEEAFALVSQADFWLNTGALKSYGELKSSFPKFASVECVVKGNVFNNNKRTNPAGGNDCYESGIVNPDLILRDLIKIFHPDVIDDELFYYHKLK